MQALIGGIPVEGKLLKDEQPVSITVFQFTLKEYPAAFAASDDEFELVALAIRRDKEFVQSLLPETYELLLKTVEEINAGFFVYADRQTDKIAKRLNAMKPHVIQSMKLRASEESPSNNMRRGLQPQ